MRVDPENRGLHRSRAKRVKEPITVFDVRGIGGDFNIFLPEKEDIDLEELKQPLSTRFTILAGKYAGDESHRGNANFSIYIKR